MEQNVLQLGNAGVELALLVFRLVIFAVLGQVAEGTGFLDQFGHFLLADGLQIGELLFQFFQALGAESVFFRHGDTPFAFHYADAAAPWGQSAVVYHLSYLL